MAIQQVHCPFCSMPQERAILKNDLAVGIADKYPVSPGHALVMPKRHVADFFELTAPERDACFRLLGDARVLVLAQYPEASGFNVGVNVGADAGQTVFHCHIHLIPRFVGDVENPRGGVRGVIPHKRNYSGT